MALRWDWDDKMGTATHSAQSGTYEVNIYQGNALMIALNEWEEDGTAYHSLAGFAADENHFKNILGLSKDYDGCWDQMQITKIRLNTKYKSVPKIVQLLAKAKTQGQIELYPE